MLKDIAPRDWGSFVVSLIILTFFGLYEVAILFQKVPKDDTLSGILNNLVVLVAGYWIGSSSGSKNKDAVIAQAATASQAETAKQENGKVVAPVAPVSAVPGGQPFPRPIPAPNSR
jgi:hypothetical protein